MATTTNYSWTTPDDTDLVKDGAAAIRTLGSSIDTTTKNLNPSTTLGDIEYRSATANTNTRLAIGSAGQVLTVAAGVPSWATASSGGMTLISTTTLSGASTTITVAANSYIDLVLQCEAIDCSNDVDVFIQLNGITGATDYLPAVIASNNGSAFSAYGKTNGIFFNLPSAEGFGTANSNFANVQIFNANSTIRKCINVNVASEHSSGRVQSVRNTVNVNATAVISSIVFKVSSNTFDGGTIKLYGVK